MTCTIKNNNTFHTHCGSRQEVCDYDEDIYRPPALPLPLPLRQLDQHHRQQRDHRQQQYPHQQRDRLKHLSE